MHRIIAMWAHQRALSTAFLRMMIERGDVLVVHEPLVTLIDEGEVSLPDGRGGQHIVRSESALFDHLRELAQQRPVYFKDTVEHRYRFVFEHPEAIADFVHTFIVREPRRPISSLFHMKPTAACSEVGYEHLWEIYDMVSRRQGVAPVVVGTERLLSEPAAVVRRYCELVGLPFIERALHWRPEDRPEWARTRRWHTEVLCSSGFQAVHHEYAHTVDNHPVLRRFYDHHYPFYERLARHAI